eukprot:1716825-Rhodomonas_salina.1
MWWRISAPQGRGARRAQMCAAPWKSLRHSGTNHHDLYQQNRNLSTKLTTVTQLLRCPQFQVGRFRA